MLHHSKADEAEVGKRIGDLLERRQQLEKKSVGIAGHVFAEKPARWRARIESWWEIASK